MLLPRNIISFDLSSSLHIDEHQTTCHIFDDLDMGNYRVRLCKAQKLHNFPLLYLVHPDLAYAILHILHVNQVMTIKVEGHTVLRESHIVRSVLHKHVFFEITDADRVKIWQLLDILGRVTRYRDCQHTVVLLV